MIAVGALFAGATLFSPRAEAAAGDPDCDGSITSLDAMLVLQRSAGLIGSLPCNSAADVNSDGQVNSLDAAFILQRVAGLITSFPTCNSSPAPPNAQPAIDNASAGQTVCLRAGTYNTLFFYRKSGITVLGAGSSATIISDNPEHHFCILVIESSNITVRGMKAQNCTDQGVYVGQSTNVKFEQVNATGSPIGFDYQNSSGRLTDVNSSNNGDFGALVQTNANVTIEDSTFNNNGWGILSQDGATVHVMDSSLSGNPDGGIFVIKSNGSGTIERTSISSSPLGVFVGMPGCAALPPADSTPPQCYVDNPNAYRSTISFRMSSSTVNNISGTGVVIFPGVSAVLQNNTIRNAGLTGLFAWGATVDAGGNEYDSNVENAVECRAYPAPDTGDRGMCRLTYEHLHNSEPLPGNVLGGGFIAAGGALSLRFSVIENNWGIGVQVLNGAPGEVLNNTIRNNGGTAFCISGAGTVNVSGNNESGNRPGTCLGHP